MSHLTVDSKVGDRSIFRFEPFDIDYDVKVNGEVIGHVKAGRGVFVADNVDEIELVPCTHDEQIEIHSLGPVTNTNTNRMYEIMLTQDCDFCEIYEVKGDEHKLIASEKVKARKVRFIVPVPQKKMVFAVKVGDQFSPSVQFSGM